MSWRAAGNCAPMPPMERALVHGRRLELVSKEQTLNSARLLALGTVLVLASACASRQIQPPTEVARFCRDNTTVLVENESYGRAGPSQDWTPFVKSLPESVVKPPVDCERVEWKQRCAERTRRILRDAHALQVGRGTPPLASFEGTTIRLTSSTAHRGPISVTVHRVGAKALITLRATARSPDRDGASWTWTRAQPLSLEQWRELERTVEQARLYDLPSFSTLEPSLADDGEHHSLELYDGKRHVVIGRSSGEPDAAGFFAVVRLLTTYARCSG